MYGAYTIGISNTDLDTKILEVNLFAFSYRLFHEDFSPINSNHHSTAEIFMKQPVGKSKQINF